MNSVSAFNPEKSLEFQALEKKLSEVDTKLTSIFNRLSAQICFSTVGSTILTIGSVVLLTLATTAILLFENPLYATFVKGTLIFGSVFGLITLGTFILMGLNSREVIANNSI